MNLLYIHNSHELGMYEAFGEAFGVELPTGNLMIF